MTLTRLKSNFKLAATIAVFLVYSIGLFFLGHTYNKTQQAPNSAQTQEVAGNLQKPLPQNEIQSAKVLASSVKLCSNTVYSYQLAYPNNWFTTYNKDPDACSYFAPFSFILPEVVDRDITPITIKRIDPKQWEETVKSNQNPTEIYNVEKSQKINVNGKLGQFLRLTSTGTIITTGFVKDIYFLPDENNPLEVSYTQQASKENVADMEKILKDLVDSLKFY